MQRAFLNSLDLKQLISKPKLGDSYQPESGLDGCNDQPIKAEIPARVIEWSDNAEKNWEVILCQDYSFLSR